MKHLTFLILTATFLQLNIGFAQKSSGSSVDNKPIKILGIYEYKYEYNTKDLTENHYIKLEEINGKISGIYYGTSDDFDEDREGYLPGFFKANMLDILITDSTINFKVKVNSSDIYEKAITPFDNPKNNKQWTIGLRYNERSYLGRISRNRIVVETIEFDKRPFVKIK
jgi:hypothetical protein